MLACIGIGRVKLRIQSLYQIRASVAYLQFNNFFDKDADIGTTRKTHGHRNVKFGITFACRIMDLMKKGWFSEKNDLWPGVSLSLEVNEILHQDKSEYQDILVLDT